MKHMIVKLDVSSDRTYELRGSNLHFVGPLAAALRLWHSACKGGHDLGLVSLKPVAEAEDAKTAEGGGK